MVVPIIFLVVISYVADALWPKLVNSHPLLLMGMNARNRNLALVATHVAPVPYYVVGTLRLLVSDPLFYLLGWWYGDGAVRWVENRWGETGPVLRWVEKYFGKASYPLVFFAPNNLICALAGSVGMPPAAFLAVNITGTIVRLFLIRWLGDVFSKPIDWFREFVGRYTMFILPITIAIVAVLVWREWRRGTSEVQHLRDLTEEFGEDD